MVSFIKHINKRFRQHNKAINQDKKLIIEEIKKISEIIKNLIVLKKNNKDTKFIKALLCNDLIELRQQKKQLVEQKKLLNSFKFQYLKNDVEIKKEEENINNECAICLENIKNEHKLNCKHKFCKECIERVIEINKIKCPLCRQITNIKIKYDYDKIYLSLVKIDNYTYLELCYENEIFFYFDLKYKNYHRNLNFYQSNYFKNLMTLFLNDLNLFLIEEMKNINFDLFDEKFEKILNIIRNFEYCYEYNDNVHKIKFSYDIRKLFFNSIEVDIV